MSSGSLELDFPQMTTDLRNPLITLVLDDTLHEEDECYTIRILNPNIGLQWNLP